MYPPRWRNISASSSCPKTAKVSPPSRSIVRNSARPFSFFAISHHLERLLVPSVASLVEPALTEISSIILDTLPLSRPVLFTALRAARSARLERRGRGNATHRQPLPREPHRPRVCHLRPPLGLPRPLVEVLLEDSGLHHQIRVLHQLGQEPLVLECLVDVRAQIPVEVGPQCVVPFRGLGYQPPDLVGPLFRPAAFADEAQAPLILQAVDFKPHIHHLRTHLLEGRHAFVLKLVLDERPAPRRPHPEKGGVQAPHQLSVLSDCEHVVRHLDERPQPPR